jgi:shikimate dehydrogenase
MTKRVGIIGWTVSHSISPAMHNATFKALGMDWQYDAMAIPPDIVRYGIKEPMQHGFIGVNVTSPHKQEVMKIVKPDEIARAIGAVNTVDFRDLTGTNTDVYGFIDDLKAFEIPIKDQTVIVLGAGGASRAAVYGLWREGANITVVNRSMEQANKMLADLAISAGIMSRVNVLTLEDASTLPASLIVNATSAGMHPNEDLSAWDENIPFPSNITLYDMIYRQTYDTS